MRAQLQGVSANIALQGGVLEQIRMDSSCRVCWGNVERCCSEAAADESDMEESQSPSTRPFYNFQYNCCAKPVGRMSLGYIV